MYYNQEDGSISPESDLGKLIDSLLDDDRKDKIRDYYYQDNKYLAGISTTMRMFDYFEYHKDMTFNVVKTTRAGFTTNCILSALFKNKKILLVAPTNKILYQTVEEAYRTYKKVSGDPGKLIRPIPNNIDGCTCVRDKINKYPQLKLLPFLSSEDCKYCSNSEYKSFRIGGPYYPYEAISKSTDHCMIKTMLNEYKYSADGYSPDVLTITYDKLRTLGSGEKNKLFTDLISKVDIIVFDEIGEYLSRSQESFEYYTEANQNIRDPNYYRNILVSRISLIKNKSSRDIMIHFYKNYISPFLDFLSSNQIGTFPKIINNPLTEQHITDMFNTTPIVKKRMTINKQETLRKKYREYYQVIESLTVNNEPQELISLLLGLLNMMIKKQFLLYEVNTVKYIPHKIKIKSLFIMSAKNELMEVLNNYTLPGKVIIISDATMPVNNLKEYKARKVKNIFYGDPSNNNKSLLMFHDKTIEQFSKYLYFRNMQYRTVLFERLIEILKLNHYGNEVIWTSSKDVALDLSQTLNNLGVSTCTYKEPNPNSVMVTYYGSSFTRGVKSERRFQILLGKANKPRDSYKHIAFLRRNEWDFLSEKELTLLADKENLSYEDFIEEINRWNNKQSLRDYIFLDKNIPPNLQEYFNLLSYSVLKEKIYMDSWQAASRAKDPGGRGRSINICLGWNVNEVYNMIKWGSNNNISYSLSEKRLLKTQDNLVPMPYIISSDKNEIIRSWLRNEDIKHGCIGFNKSLLDGIKDLITEKGLVKSEEIWLSLCDNNMDFSNSSDKYDNGYLVGAINSAIMFDIEDNIEITKVDNTHYIFKYSPDNKYKIKKYHINKSEFLDILEVLRAIYLINKLEINYSDIRYFISEKKISTKRLHEIYDIMISNNIFNGSTWIVKNNRINKITSEKKQYYTCIEISNKFYSKNKTQLDTVNHLIYWYYNEKDIHEINLENIANEVPIFAGSPEAVKIALNYILNTPEWYELVYSGLKIEIDDSCYPSDLIFSRKNIVY